MNMSSIELVLWKVGHDRIIDRIMPCEVAYQKLEENEIKLQFPVPTSGGDRFRKSTSGLTGYHQNVEN